LGIIPRTLVGVVDSQLDSNRHSTRNVVAKSLIEVAFSWYFTAPYKNLDIQPMVDADYKGVELKYK